MVGCHKEHVFFNESTVCACGQQTRPSRREKQLEKALDIASKDYARFYDPEGTLSRGRLAEIAARYKKGWLEEAGE